MDQSTRVSPVVEPDEVDVFVGLLVANQPTHVQERAPRFKAWLRSLSLPQLDAFIARLDAEAVPA